MTEKDLEIYIIILSSGRVCIRVSVYMGVRVCMCVHAF